MMRRSRKIISSQDATTLDAIRNRSTTALEALVGRGKPVAIVDAPNQRNVGDSLIWLGELAYLSRIGAKIRYVSDIWTHDAEALRRSLPVGGVVLFHGGGNFGDLWLGHQRLREQVAEELTDYRVVQLPQSIYFKDAERASLANSILSNHPDFHVLVRDSLSMQRMSDQLPDVSHSYCPDMAFGWDPPVRRSSYSQTSDVVVLARADLEASSGLAIDAATWTSIGEVQVTDWGPRGVWSVAWDACRLVSRGFMYYAKLRKRLRWLPTGLVDRSFEHVITQIARVNIAGAERLYRSTSYLVVDRLHAHVLAILLNVPHTALDNSYGKVSSIFEDYSGEFTTAKYAKSTDEAFDHVVRYQETS